MLKSLVATLIGLAASLIAAQAASSDPLNLYCSAPPRRCIEMASAFQRATDIRVEVTHLHSIDALDRIRTETSSPKGDVWWGGSYLVHVETALLGLTQEYEAQRLWQLHAWAVMATRRSGYRTFPIHARPQRFAVNDAAFSALRQAPACWADLLDYSLHDRVDIPLHPHPIAAVAAITPLSALLGERLTYALIRQHRAEAPSSPAVVGDHHRTKARPQVSLLLDDDADQGLDQGWSAVRPCEGTSYAMSAVSIVRGTYNFTAAEAWLDWALSAEGQAISRGADRTLIPSHRSVAVSAAEVDKADLFLSGQALESAMGDDRQSQLKILLQTGTAP